MRGHGHAVVTARIGFIESHFVSILFLCERGECPAVEDKSDWCIMVPLSESGKKSD